MARDASDGPLGPGNPPRSTRFQKGRSGNPGGRPKMERDFAKLIDSELDEVVTGDTDGRKIKLTKRQFIAKRLVSEAAKGDLRALDRIINLVGKSPSIENKLIGIEPAVLASFLARYTSNKGNGGAGGSTAP